MKITIATTRYNNETWEQQNRWKFNNNFTGSIYGTPRMIQSKILTNSIVCVVEMHNDLNKIIGFGLIRNQPVFDKKYKLYDWGNYNRYTYKSNYRIDIDSIDLEKNDWIERLEKYLFKGSRHMKRGQGITKLSQWIIENSDDSFDVLIRQLFLEIFLMSK